MYVRVSQIKPYLLLKNQTISTFLMKLNPALIHVEGGAISVYLYAKNHADNEIYQMRVGSTTSKARLYLRAEQAAKLVDRWGSFLDGWMRDKWESKERRNVGTKIGIIGRHGRSIAIHAWRYGVAAKEKQARPSLPRNAWHDLSARFGKTPGREGGRPLRFTCKQGLQFLHARRWLLFPVLC
jgi:hypothetical protein